MNQKRKLPSPACGGGVGGGGKLQLERARKLRTNATEAEQRLWYFLRAKRLMGLKFKRQKPIGRYIVDFVCLQPKLIIELDGGQHAEQVHYDRQRDTWLQSQGFRTLRFWNNQVLSETPAVLEQIRREVLALSPGPSPASGRGELTVQTEE
ncbi:endonuclease domain-containing protein [Microbulbifer taiwanensis]|uniref:endonuclease domain-containing protein n=1 Tax=Microbulbifer taiwanensis TaxID=986746 RepID=UPI00361A1DE7